jgi:hypothetical protein
MSLDKDKLRQENTTSTRWSRGDKIAALSLLIGIMAFAAALVVPEARRWLGLDSDKEVETKQPKLNEEVFPYCVKVNSWNKDGGQPIVAARVSIRTKGYSSNATTESDGCANFEIPASLYNESGTITVTTAENRTQTITQNIRGPSISIIFNPND